MSYTIEYDRQFIISDKGYTPCWNAGDNNVTQYRNGREVRSRDWSVFYNLLGVTEQDILNAVKHSLRGYNEHWRKGGKWITDDGLIRWIKNGCKNAATIEDILTANRLRSVECYLSVWDKDYKNIRALDTYVSTTEQLDKWIEAVQEYKAENSMKHIYPVINLYNPYEKMVHPSAKDKKKPEQVLIKSKWGYVYEITSNGTGTRDTPDITQAKIFPFAEAEEFVNKYWGMKIIDASPLLSNPYNAVLKHKDGETYIKKVSSRHVWFTDSPAVAHHYPNVKAAEKSLEALSKKWNNASNYCVVEVTSAPL